MGGTLVWCGGEAWHWLALVTHLLLFSPLLRLSCFNITASPKHLSPQPPPSSLPRAMKRLRLTAAYLNSTWHGLPYAGTFYTVLTQSPNHPSPFPPTQRPVIAAPTTSTSVVASTIVFGPDLSLSPKNRTTHPWHRGFGILRPCPNPSATPPRPSSSPSQFSAHSPVRRPSVKCDTDARVSTVARAVKAVRAAWAAKRRQAQHTPAPRRRCSWWRKQQCPGAKDRRTRAYRLLRHTTTSLPAALFLDACSALPCPALPCPALPFCPSPSLYPSSLPCISSLPLINPSPTPPPPTSLVTSPQELPIPPRPSPVLAYSPVSSWTLRTAIDSM
ncbi:extensin-like [Portunus trituberculatus]|uniref:extensin-like n=1 Tax=Portunus trituberculatus TaxID=210409 RepID=UPI001E1D000D|nr:extensin-like [Portunus trituberculatus]